MNERSNLIFKLVSDIDTRTAYIRAKLGTLVPAQIRALRLKSDMPRQADLAKAADMQQSRISMFETPGAANVTLETLSRLAAAFEVGVVVKFVPFSEMLRWENGFSQDHFNVKKITADTAFLSPAAHISADDFSRKMTANIAATDKQTDSIRGASTLQFAVSNAKPIQDAFTVTESKCLTQAV